MRVADEQWQGIESEQWKIAFYWQRISLDKMISKSLCKSQWLLKAMCESRLGVTVDLCALATPSQQSTKLLFSNQTPSMQMSSGFNFKCWFISNLFQCQLDKRLKTSRQIACVVAGVNCVTFTKAIVSHFCLGNLLKRRHFCQLFSGQ